LGFHFTEEESVSFWDALFGGGALAVDVATAKAKLSAKPAPFLLDVRQPDEFSAGHIAGATLIPLHELPTRLTNCRKTAKLSAYAARAIAAARRRANWWRRDITLSICAAA
jgi:3-mercaptopyruvate sulfurtransferase SseA